MCACYNPPRFDRPFGWLTRDHRKMLVVDGRVAFVTGLCVGRMLGRRSRARDRSVARHRRRGARPGRGRHRAGVRRGLGLARRSAAPGDARGDGSDQPRTPGVALRVVATVPNTAGMFRLDQLIAAMARQTLWMTDAYFVGDAPYVQALRAAARDGVDVRLLVPGASDIPLCEPLSRAGYRPLLEAGVRVFEWNGSMLHAKTAVADGRWARVGSTNLNIASWIGNWELDVDHRGRGVRRRDGGRCSRPIWRTLPRWSSTGEIGSVPPERQGAVRPPAEAGAA